MIRKTKIIFFYRINFLSPVSMVINRVSRDDKGMYQCITSNKKSSAQAVAELKLGGELKTNFYYCSSLI